MQSFTPPRALLLTIGITSLAGCSRKEEPKFAARERSAATTEPAAKEADSGSGDGGEHSISGEHWESIKVVNDSPLCVFSNYEERVNVSFPYQAKRQKLEAGKPLIFGVYAPECMNGLCYMPPSIQCWVEEPEKGVIKVESRFWTDHKKGSTCSDNCQPTSGDCRTSELKPGKYTVMYGEQTYTLRIPSVLQSPCLNK
jgi:hypothetical protein